MIAIFLLLNLVSGLAAAAPAVPSREVPPSVLVELQLLENRFELALAADCNAERCFSKGCSYVDHAVADQPRSGSLPGLGEEAGPGSIEAQAYLTQARCSFAHEQSESVGDIQTLVRRLQARLSTGWTVVSVDAQALQPLPAHLREVPEPVAEELEAEPEPVLEAPVAEPEEWSGAVAGRELWTTLLPHLFWMIGGLLFAGIGSMLIWSWRRVGRLSPEEQLLLAQMARSEGDASTGEATPQATVEEAEDDTFVAEQEAAWRARLEAMDPDRPDPKLEALIRALLRSGDMPLLAKAVLRFPEILPAAFPTGGDVAAAKLELADTLKTVDVSSLPSDRELFQALNRHALAATLSTQSDAEIVRSLREDFGAAGLADLVGRLPARVGALVFALAPPAERHEVVRLLPVGIVADMVAQLLRSNRMDESETAWLFEVVRAVREGRPLPAVPPAVEVTDRGAAFDAAAALSVLLPRLDPAERGALFKQAVSRFHGTVPTWYRDILVPDMLFELSRDDRADLLLEVEGERLAAWLSFVEEETRSYLLEDMPDALRGSIKAASVFPSRARQLTLAEQGRRDLARGFQRLLARAGLSFEKVLQPRAVEVA